jgi:hypothetical protein
MQLALRALQTSMGPVGWLVLGVGLIAEAFVFMAGSTEDAADAMKDLNAEFDRDKLGDFKEEVSDTTRVLNGLTNELEKWRYERIIRDQHLLQGQLKTLKKDSKEYNEALAEFNKLETERQELRKKAGVTDLALPGENIEKLTDKQIEELDKLRDYQFKTNRITLADYIAHLESRQAAVKEKLGEETAQYLKFVDNLQKLRQQLAEETLELPLKLDIKTPDIPEFDLANIFKFDSAAQGELARGFFDELFQLQLQFSETSFEALESEFQARKGFAELNLQIARDAFTEESDEYAQALQFRLDLERSFINAKTRLQVQGAKATAEAGSALLNVFQGQSKTFFEIGKAASIANMTITQFEAAARAFKDYPFPFNIGIAAIQLALVAGYIGRINAVQFNPGFAEGTKTPLTQADVIQSVFTPPGESGLVAVQTGEFIMNRKATAQFSDILSAMNRGQFVRPVIQRFQAGGPVGTVSPSPTLPAAAPNAVTVEDLNRIVDAIKEVRIEIESSIDGIQFLRKNYPRYDKTLKQKRL